MAGLPAAARAFTSRSWDVLNARSDRPRASGAYAGLSSIPSWAIARPNWVGVRLSTLPPHRRVPGVPAAIRVQGPASPLPCEHLPDPPNTAPGSVFFTKEHRVMFSGRIVHRAKQLPHLPRRPRVTAPVMVPPQPRPRRRLATLAGRPPTRRARHHSRRLHPGLPPGLAGPPPARRDQVEQGCTFPPRGPVRYRSTGASTSSTGAHRPEPCDRRLSSRPALPASSYRSSQRRNVRSQTPSKRAASSCVRRLSVQPPDASSNRAIRGSGHHAVRLLRYILLHPMKPGQLLGYKTGQLMGSLHPQDRGMH